MRNHNYIKSQLIHAYVDHIIVYSYKMIYNQKDVRKNVYGYHFKCRYEINKHNDFKIVQNCLGPML